MTYSVSYGYRLQSLANTRLHWAAKAKVVKLAKQQAILATLATVPPRSRLSARWSRACVTITRVGPRRLDIDNLYSSAKPVIDGVASVFGVDDGSDFWEWKCVQAKGAYSVRIAFDLVPLQVQTIVEQYR